MSCLSHLTTQASLCFLVMGLLICATPIDARAQASDQVSELVKKATKARASGQLRQSLTTLQAAHALSPQALFLNNMGKLHEELGEYDLAVAKYREVTNDPKASTELRMLDAARISALEPKLSRAWVRVTDAQNWSQVRVDHVYCPIEGQVEVAVTPGSRIVEIQYAPGKDVGLYGLQLRAGRRHDLSPDLIAHLRTQARMLVIGLSPRPVSVTVGEHLIDASMSGVEQILVPPGLTRIRLMAPNGKWLDLEHNLTAAEATSLAGLAGDGWRNINRAGQLSTEAVGVDGEQNGGLKLMTASLGATLVGSGLFLYFDVEEGRSILMDETRSPDITIRDAAARWESLNSRAAVGGILTGLGSAVVVGTAFWWWKDRSARGGLASSHSGELFTQPWCVGEMCGLSLGGSL